MKRRILVAVSLSLGVATLAASPLAEAQRRGRKYKAPPDTSHIEVTVVRDNNGKPVPSAAVVFHPTKDGHDEGNLEVKTDSEGRAIIDVIPTGSDLGVQVIADGFATYAGSYKIATDDSKIEIRMLKPRAQISAYVDTHGQASDRPVGVQEPSKPGSTAPVIQAPRPTNHTSDPNPLAPVDKDATPGNSQNQQTGPKPSGVPPQL